MFDWIIKKIVKGRWDKLVKGAGTTFVSLVAPQVAQHFGIELTEEQKLALSVAVGGVIEKGSNWLKHTFPQQLGWL